MLMLKIKIQKDLGYPSNVQFLGVSFDPLRDTPDVLHRYKEVFKVSLIKQNTLKQKPPRCCFEANLSQGFPN